MKIYCSGDLVSWSRGAMLVMLTMLIIIMLLITMLIITMLISMLITGAGHGVLPARGPGRLRADTEVGVQERGRPQPAPHRVPRNRGRGRGRAARAAQMGRSSRLETQIRCFKSRFYPRSNFQWANSINYKLPCCGPVTQSAECLLQRIAGGNKNPWDYRSWSEQHSYHGKWLQYPEIRTSGPVCGLDPA